MQEVLSEYELLKDKVERVIQPPHYVRLLKDPWFKNQIYITYFCGARKKKPKQLLKEICNETNTKFKLTWYSEDMFHVLRMRIQTK